MRLNFARAACLPVALFVVMSPLDGAAEPAEKKEPVIVAVHIVSSVADAAADDKGKRALKDEIVSLAAVLEARDGKRRVFFSDVSSFRIRGKRHVAKPIEDAPTHLLVWNKIEPTLETMSNTASGKFRFETIEYGESFIFTAMSASTIEADVRPTLTTDRGDGVGTMRFQVTAIGGHGMVSSPGLDSRAGKGRGGLSAAVHRITIRRDNSYIGFLTELYGQPYIWASAGKTDRNHQSETLEGSDCADFVVYGHRRMGGKVPYTWTGGLPKHTVRLARGDADADGIYRDDRGNPIAFPKIGDLALFPRHVGVLTVDRGSIGILDHADVMMHSYFASPREQSLGDSDYAGTWIELRRFK